jgi:hypothetical protein
MSLDIQLRPYGSPRFISRQQQSCPLSACVSAFCGCYTGPDHTTRHSYLLPLAVRHSVSQESNAAANLTHSALNHFPRTSCAAGQSISYSCRSASSVLIDSIAEWHRCAVLASIVHCALFQNGKFLEIVFSLWPLILGQDKVI